MGSFPKAEQIVDDGAINRIVPASEPGALAPVRAGEAPNELWEWLRLLNRRKALIVGCGLVAVALMALIIAQATPMYKASARLLLDTRTFKVVSTEAALSGVDTMNLGAIQSELEVIQSEFLIGRVVDKLGLANNPDFNGTKPPGFIDSAFAPLRELWATGISTLLAPAPKPQPTTAQPARTSRPAEESDPRRRSAIGAVSGGLSVTLLGRTFVILITVESPDGTMSARIANAVAEAYLADQIDTKNEANRRATEWLEQRLAELRRNLQVAEEAVASYRRDKGLAGSPEGAVSTQTLSDLNGKYVGARTKRIEREARLVALSRASLNPGEIANIAEVAGNTTLAALRVQDVELTRKMAELSSMLGDNHPKMVQARAELASVRARFLSETQRITLAVRAELDASKAEEDELKELVDKAAVVSGTASQYEAEQKQLEREAQSNRTLYESFLTRFKELREQQDIQRADARILAYAHPSGAPSSPNYKTGLMAAFVIGCLLGMAGAVAAEKLDRVFRSAAQVEEATGVGVLGMVPEVKGAAAAALQRGRPRAREHHVAGRRGDPRGVHRHQPGQPRPAAPGHRRHLLDAERGQDHLRRLAGRPAHQDERLAARADRRPRPAPGQDVGGARPEGPRRHHRRLPDGPEDPGGVHQAARQFRRRLHPAPGPTRRTRRKSSNRTP